MNLSQAKNEQYMQWAVSGSKIFSTCSRRQYMAIVLSADGRIIGTGYNGAPPGFVHCTDGGCPRANSESPAGSSYGNCIAIHAEANALIHSDRSARLGGTLIINGPPCYDCAKLISGSGVARVVFMTDPAYAEWGKVRMLLQKAGITMIEVDRARIAGASLSGKPYCDVGSGAEQEVGVEIQPSKSAPVERPNCLQLIMGTSPSIDSYDSRVPDQYR